MPNDLEQLTNKIYREGIDKANQEAESIKNKAQEEADQLLENAKKEGERIKKEARDEAETFRQNTEAEIKLAGRKALNQLKNDIENLINDTILRQPVSEVMADREFLKKFILSLTEKWKKDENIVIELNVEFKEELEEAFKGSLQQKLPGLTLEENNKLSRGFRIGKKGESYKITFTEEDFFNFFSAYLKASTRTLIFDDS